MKNKIVSVIVIAIISVMVITIIFKVSTDKKVDSVQESHSTIDSVYRQSTTLSVSTTETSNNKKEMNDLVEYLDQLKQENLGIYIKDLETGTEFGVNDTQLFYGASIAKLPIILYTQHALETSVNTWEDAFPYIEEVNTIPGAMIKGGTGELQKTTQVGEFLTIQNLLKETIIHSDNLANNMLGYYVANENGTEFKSFLSPYYESEIDVFTKDLSAKTAGKLMEDIYNKRTVNTWLSQTEWATEKIGVLDKVVYHKIGVNEPYNHDVGVVAGEHPYVLSILTNGKTNKEIEKMVSQIDNYLERE